VVICGEWDYIKVHHIVDNNGSLRIASSKFSLNPIHGDITTFTLTITSHYNAAKRRHWAGSVEYRAETLR